MDIIKELWYGNVAPFEQCTRGDNQLKELLKLVARNKEELDASLTDKQKEILEKISRSTPLLCVNNACTWKADEGHSDVARPLGYVDYGEYL